MTTALEFVKQLAAGETNAAKEVISDLLSNMAFEALENKKQEVAKTIFGESEQVNEEQEQLDELSYDKLEKYKRAAKKDIRKNSYDGKPLAGKEEKVEKRVTGFRKAWQKQEQSN